jgi:hypothetical protein
MFLHFLVLDYENYYPKGKKEVPKGDGSKKSESKRKLLCSLFFVVCKDHVFHAVVWKLASFNALDN